MEVLVLEAILYAVCQYYALRYAAPAALVHHPLSNSGVESYGCYFI